jgi:O-antigen ligase/polysaccharide polymerase Wzy-like membrane protein
MLGVQRSSPGKSSGPSPRQERAVSLIFATGLIAALGIVVWLWRRHREPLIYLAPFALAFSPLVAFGGRALGWPGAWLSTRVVLVLSIVISVGFRVVRRDFSWYRIPGLWFIAPYLVLVTASVLWSVLGPYNGEADKIANEFLSWGIIVAVFLCVAGSSTGQSTLKDAILGLIAVGLGACVYAGFQALVLTGNEQLVPGPIVDLTRYAREELQFGALRLHGTLPNLGPNFFGAFLLGPTVLAFSRAFGQRGFARLTYFLIGVACAAAIAGTYSRGAMLGLAVALLALPLWRRSGRALAATLGVIVVMAMGLARTPIGRNAAALYASGQLDVSGRSRVYLWKAILSGAADHPLGLGFNGWSRASRPNLYVGLDDGPASIGSGHAAENQWMRELADRGIPGVLALALLMIGIMHLTFRTADPSRLQGQARDFLSACGATCAGWTVVLLTGDHLAYDNTAGIFWYAIGLTLAVAREATRPVASETHRLDT